jgi:hypothetical protein
MDANHLRSAWERVAEDLNGWTNSDVVEGKNHANGDAAGHVNGNGNGARHDIRRLPWQEHDLRGLPRDEAQKWIQSFLETDVRQEMSAQRFPLMRTAIVWIEDHECELVWTLHPALRDTITVGEAITRLARSCSPGMRITELKSHEIAEIENCDEEQQLAAAISADSEDLLEDGAEH